MSDTDTVPELPSIKKYTVPRTIFMYRKTIESQGKNIQQLEAVVFAQQGYAYQQYQTIRYLRKLRVLQQKHIDKQANSLVRMRFSLSQHLTKIMSIKSELRDIADNLMETQNFAQQTSSELSDPTPSERLEKCAARLELFVKEILACSIAGLGQERRD